MPEIETGDWFPSCGKWYTWNLPGIITGSKSTGDEASKDNDHMITMVKLHGLFSHKLGGGHSPHSHIGVILVQYWWDEHSTYYIPIARASYTHQYRLSIQRIPRNHASLTVGNPLIYGVLMVYCGDIYGILIYFWYEFHGIPLVAH